MTDIFFTRIDRNRAGFDPVFRFMRSAASCFVRACSTYRQRQALAELDDRLLADIGLSREDVASECARSWWPV